jgi:hypothetical protein
LKQKKSCKINTNSGCTSTDSKVTDTFNINTKARLSGRHVYRWINSIKLKQL